MSELVKVCGLWKSEGKNGTYYSGVLKADQMDALKELILQGKPVKFLVFQNKSDNERAPQLQLMASELEDKYADGKPKPKTNEEIPF